jgi:hypothetical protein
MLALLCDRWDQIKLGGNVCKFLVVRDPRLGNRWTAYRFKSRTNGVPLRSELLTTLMWPNRMPRSGPPVSARHRTLRKTRTQPFSITKLNARTVSSIGTNQVSPANTVKAGVCGLLTGWIRAVGEDDVHIVEL